MPITVNISITNGTATGGRAMRGILSVENTGANSVSVKDAILTELSSMGAVFGQPSFLTANVAAGAGEPTITAGSTAYYPFSVMVPGPNTPGASPSPTLHHDNVFPPSNSACRVSIQVRTYDSVAAAFVIGSSETQFPVLSSVAPFPVPQGGAEQFNAGGDAVNWFF